MSFLLRVDVDKPYGHKSMVQKFMSKAREDVAFPASSILGYLHPTKDLIEFLNEKEVPAFFFFRLSTLPTKKIMDLLDEGSHEVGFHAENTRSQLSFSREFSRFQNHLDRKVVFFTKHGSGKLKLGKNHFAPYEPEKYRTWAKELGYKYQLGNGIAAHTNDFMPVNDFIESMFWLERNYRSDDLEDLDSIISIARQQLVPLVVHPANFATYVEVRRDLSYLISKSEEFQIKWITTLSP